MNILANPPLALAVLLLTMPELALAHGTPPDPLRGVKVPATPGLVSGSRPIVVNKKAATQLGKALFWDAGVGSDGIACATCHAQGGADGRTRNQLDPGTKHVGAPTSTTFEKTASGAAGGPDYELRQVDFPLMQFRDPTDKYSEILFQTDDVVSSSGAFLGQFAGAAETEDRCDPLKDDIFHAGGRNTRQVSVRNAPTVINAAFNFRQFWDGRANNLFNGESAFGARDPDAGVWVAGKANKQRILLKNASLASQAVAPPLDTREMSCVSRTFHALGRRLLPRRPLERQAVHPEDSVLAGLRDASGTGLNVTYADLIRKAFASRYWSARGTYGPAEQGGEPYTQMEANFAFFFGLALQLYQETLIADQSPFDGRRDKDNVPVDFNDRQRHGLQVFLDAHCFICHVGPHLSSAAHPKVYSAKSVKFYNLVNRSGMSEDGDGIGVAGTLLDTGFNITSVAPWEYDIGIGGTDPFGHPLSFTAQYLNTLENPGRGMLDPIDVVACEMDMPFAYNMPAADLVPDPNGKGHCRGYKQLSRIPTPEVIRRERARPGEGMLPMGINAAFKVPSLRNVELTGPYMHNGSMKSLEEVVAFYNRGGNVDNPHHIGTLVFPLGLSEEEQADLVLFLKSLTDERVRWERAPFDHPELLIPHGHKAGASPRGPDYAADDYLHLPAVGRNGRTAEQGPLKPFVERLKP